METTTNPYLSRYDCGTCGDENTARYEVTRTPVGPTTNLPNLDGKTVCVECADELDELGYEGVPLMTLAEKG